MVVLGAPRTPPTLTVNKPRKHPEQGGQRVEGAPGERGGHVLLMILHCWRKIPLPVGVRQQTQHGVQLHPSEAQYGVSNNSDV